MMYPIIFIFTTLFVITVIRWWKNWRTWKLMEKIPGPYQYPILGALPYFFGSLDSSWNHFRNFAQYYYPIYKFWIINIPVVNLLIPEDIEILLSSSKHLNKSSIYKFLEPWLGKGVVNSSGPTWRKRRKLVTPAFHNNILMQFPEVFVKHSEDLVKTIEEKCNASYVTIQPIISECTLISMCETMMGITLDKNNVETSKYFQAVDKMCKLIVYRLTRPWTSILPISVFTPTYWETRSVLKTLHNFTRSVINQRKENFTMPLQLGNDEFEVTPQRRLGLLDLLLFARNSELLDDNGIREEVDTFMFAGHDTTSVSISFTLLLLACHSEIQQKVYEELETVLGDRRPNYQDLQNLHYLDKVLKESLRLYPSAPFVSREIMENVVTYTGYQIPKHTSVNVQIFDLHHNPEVYPDPYKFDPERFAPENCKSRHPYAYIPFSAGPRNCIGQKFSSLVAKTILAAILRKFVVEPVDTTENISLVVGLTIKTKDPIKLRYKQR